MFLLLLQLAATTPLERRILDTEHLRAEDVSALQEGVGSGDARLQRLAARAIGRLERPALAPWLQPLLGHPAPEVRREAVNALGQLKSPFPAESLLRTERDGGVRGIIYATMGRVAPVAGVTERLLLSGLADADPLARDGAARGLEWLYRLNRTVRPDSAALRTIRRAAIAASSPRARAYLLPAMTTVRDRDSATAAAALTDPDPQVRRLAVILVPQWVADTSYLVRYEALRLAGDCGRALQALDDASEHVVLFAIDQFATRQCDPGPVLRQLSHRDWRHRAHAIVALARLAPEAARARIPALAADTIWQMRTYVATAAALIRDVTTLATLAADRDPNVQAAALTTGAEAVAVLGSTHNGLLLKAGQVLRGKPELAAAAPAVARTVLRLHATGQATLRDAKMELLARLGESADTATALTLRPLLADVDPEVARRAAEVITRRAGVTVQPVTTRYAFAPLPPDSVLRSLAGATATVTMRGLGTFTLALLPEEAPASAATFARNARAGVFNGLTIHRIVPNFLIQGGSPGANEYDGATTDFMPEELGLLWHDRGTMGTSTRGHDTGDGQFYINLVDNYRLDNTYTLFARVTAGMAVVDRIMEGDRIESITVVPRKP